MVDALAKRRAAGSQVVLVSSGAIAAGLAPLGLARRPRDLATQQAAAAVGQLLLAEAYARSFARYGQAIGQVLLTADDMIRRAHYRNAQRTLERLLGLGVLPVVNENDTVATDEIRISDDDRLAALVARLIGADALVLLSDVDGLCDGDPPTGRVPGCLPRSRRPRILAAVRVARAGGGHPRPRRDGNRVAAAAIALASGIPVLLASAEDDGRRARPDRGSRAERFGAAFRPSGRRGSARRFWLRRASGRAGPARPRRGRRQRHDRPRRRSLLAAGIHPIAGDFVAGDVVDLVGPAGAVVARGVVGFDAAELPGMIGRRSRELPPEQRREVVHADDLVPMG